MFGQSLLSAFGSAACTTDTDQLFATDVQTTSVATYQLNNATTSIPSNTYPGTASNITYAAGKFGNAAVFNGSSSKIEISGLSTFLASSSSKSWSCWVKTTSTGNIGNRAIISDYNTGQGNYNFDCFLTPVNGKVLLYSKAGGSSVGITSSATINDGVWHHICAVQDTATTNLKLYIDSNLEGSITIGTGTRLSSLFIGTYGVGYFWDGQIDQVRIFNTALPQSAVTALYNETTATATYPYVDYVNANPNSVAYYKMSDATDQLGNYNGTATNVNFNTEGKFGFAGAFNGSSSQLVKSNFASLSQVGISMWVNIADVNSNYTLIARYGSLKEFAIYNYQASNGFVASIYYNGNNGNAVTITAGDYLTNNTWHHIAFTSDGSTQPKLYIDGVQRGTAQSNNNTYYSTNEDLQIGGGVGRWLNGKIDQIRIYDSALSAENVTALYNEIECPAVAVTNAFNTVLYAGNATNNHAITGVGFEPSFVWIKGRTLADNHFLIDSVRGAGASLISNLTAAEGSTADLNSLDSDGFTLSSRAGVNRTGSSYVSWNWKAGGTAVSNTDGTITSQVSANVDAGFSIVKYTGNGVIPSTYGHGLSETPKIVIVKNIDASSNWTFNFNLTPTGAMFGHLNTSGPIAQTTWMGGTDSVVSMLFENGNLQNANGNDYIAYCFHSVDGYSKIGSYTGTGATGNVQYLGFEPAFVMMKAYSTTSDWFIVDNKRNANNPRNSNLRPNNSNAESNAASGLDFLSNGFEFTGAAFNDSGVSWIFMAIA